ncbi:response regulator transcription factor [Microbispora oryzae]|uniref:response regulator transcription factor n=1 Tax=Microbispora oryzae TaxID=2806554 RepID=UPI0027DC2B24|nr:response regulator transcription factor [Microbispora oryzae]
MNAPAHARIVVADDHTLFRQGLVEMISTTGDFEVVGEASTGPEAILAVGRHRPDILILDVEMPGPGAKATVVELTRLHPETRIAILTMHDDPGLLHELLRCGAAAYLVKTIARSELLAALHALTRDGRNVLLSVSRETIDRLKRNPPEPRTTLSDRELEVLQLTAQALTNSQIAVRLHIAETTVKRHLTKIYGKLGAVSRLDAIRKANAAGLLRGATRFEAAEGGPA